MITDSYIFHRQQIKVQRPEFLVKTRYRRDGINETKYSYDWESHRIAVARKSPIQFLENK